MPKRFLATTAALAAVLVPTCTWATINIIGQFTFSQFIAVQNNTPNDVTFKQTQGICVKSGPATFVAPANTETKITVVQKYYDTGLDNCYGKYHILTYTDTSNPKNYLQIKQYLSSNNWACLDIKENYVFWINFAICPEAGGNILTGKSSKNGGGVYCPPGTPYCPPFDDANSESFGFLITGSPASLEEAVIPGHRAVPRRR